MKTYTMSLATLEDAHAGDFLALDWDPTLNPMRTWFDHAIRLSRKPDGMLRLTYRNPDGTTTAKLLPANTPCALLLDADGSRTNRHPKAKTGYRLYKR